MNRSAFAVGAGRGGPGASVADMHQRRRFQPPVPGQARAPRAAVAALTPTALAICAQVHRWWRSTAR